MTSSHTANFSESGSQENAALLAFVWSTYSAGIVRDYNWNVTYLPVRLAMDDSGSPMHSGSSSIHSIGDATRSVRKTLYVGSTRAIGADVNEQGDAAYFVLREIWAIG